MYRTWWPLQKSPGKCFLCFALQATNRVCEPNPMDFPLVIDFLWSDPKGANGYGPSTRVPMVYTFGPDVAQRFLQANNLKYMLRSHETKSAGFQERLLERLCSFRYPKTITYEAQLTNTCRIFIVPSTAQRTHRHQRQTKGALTSTWWAKQ